MRLQVICKGQEILMVPTELMIFFFVYVFDTYQIQDRSVMVTSELQPQSGTPCLIHFWHPRDGS